MFKKKKKKDDADRHTDSLRMKIITRGNNITRDDEERRKLEKNEKEN